MLRERAGIIDIFRIFAKYRVAGPGAEDWLNAVLANRMPREVGRSCLTPLDRQSAAAWRAILR